MDGSIDVHMEDHVPDSTKGEKRKKTEKKSSKGLEISIRTIKTPPFSYARLQLHSESTKEPQLDALTAKSYITSALTQFLGLTGSAISIDLLKIDGSECWIRMPREDLSPVIAALGGWIRNVEGQENVGWRIRGSGNWLSTLVGSQGIEQIWNE